MKNKVAIKKDVGRPSVMTPLTLKKLEEAFALGATDKEAIFLANISPQTLYNYQREHPEFLERKEALKETLVLRALKVISDAINKNDVKTAKWYLERKKKEEFSPRIQIKHGGGVLMGELLRRIEEENEADEKEDSFKESSAEIKELPNSGEINKNEESNQNKELTDLEKSHSAKVVDEVLGEFYSRHQ